jgi:putative nucleotidyltransferase with HDIG domain
VAVVRFGLVAVERLGNLAAAGFDAGPQYLYALPVVMAPLVVALLADGRLGLVAGLASAPVLAIVTAAYPGGRLALGIFVAAVAAVGSHGGAQYRSRMVLVQAAVVLCATQALAAAAVAVLFGGESRNPRAVFTTMGLSVIGALLTAAVAALLLPLLERAFHIVSDVRLLELANADHRLLREVAIQAPGTHQHSYVMSSVATEAAKAIGANPLLARVGAYFHDVGKLHAPHMFVETLKGRPNPHDGLEPEERARLILRHVSYGIELACREGLPPQVCELITGHPGKHPLDFFLEKARSRAGEGVEVDESLFRYSGPKPQTKESAILMLADGSEAAVRSLDEPTRDNVDAIIRKITDTVVSDGQLDECGITFAEVARVREAIVEALLNLHPRRVKYPGFNAPAPGAGDHAGQISRAGSSDRYSSSLR